MKHLKDVNETYIEHCYHAMTIGVYLIKCGLSQMIHAILPDINPPFKSDLNSIIIFLESKRANNRKEIKKTI